MVLVEVRCAGENPRFAYIVLTKWTDTKKAVKSNVT